jgi:hypothetical protein
MHARVTFRSFIAFGIVISISQAARGAVLSDAIRTHYGTSDMDLLGLCVVNLGDLNHDGVEDYAIGSPGWRNAAGRADIFSGADGNLLFGFGGSGWASLTGLSIANAGDVDNDGTDDVIIGAPSKLYGLDALGAVYVLSGATGETIHEITGVFSNAGFGWVVAGAGDVDGDGYDDVAIATPFVEMGLVEIFSGLGGGALRMISIGTEPVQFGRAMANIGDVNGDGFDEIVIGAWKVSAAYIYDTHNEEFISTFQGNAGSEFGRTIANVGDFDGDGVNDFIIGAPQAKLNGVTVGGAYVLGGIAGSPLLQLHGQVDSGFGKSVGSISDFDGDGIRDFVVGSYNYGFGRVDVFSGATSAHLWTASAGPGEEFGVAVDGLQDINGDGYAELLLGHPGIVHEDGSSGAAYLFTGGPAVPFGLGMNYDYSVQGTTPVMVVAHDMDADGDLDIVALANNRLSVFTNVALGLYPDVKTYTVTSATGIAIADVDLDDLPDVIVSSFGMLTVKLYRNTGTELVYSGAFTGSGMALAVVAADFNNDGRVDLAVSDYLGSHVKVWLGKVAYTSLLSDRFAFNDAYPVGAAPIQIEAVHLNADTKCDLAILNKDSATVSILSNKGGGKFTVRPHIALEGTPHCMSFADFNGDAKQDLVTVIAGSNQVSVRSGKPSFAFAAPKFYNTPGQPRGVLARDVNGDQKPDIITTNWSQDVVSVRLRKTGGFESPITRATGIDPWSIAIGDLDGDGDRDIVTLNKTSRTISIVPNDSLY